jgi:hypothetical protein
LLLFDGAEFEAEPPKISSNKILLLLLLLVFVLVLTLLSFEVKPKSRRLLLLFVLFFSTFPFSSPGFLILIPDVLLGLPVFLLVF